MTDINITQDEIKINKENKNYTLNYEGTVVKFDANYPEAQEAARIAVEKAIEIEHTVEQGTEDFNANATLKTNAFNQNAEDKTDAFDSNATSRTNSFNSNATEKTNAYNSNASDKVAAYNENASTKTTTFDNNATSKTYDFNANASTKTAAFNDNASSKTTAFNDNYTEKKALIDAEVQTAKDWATKTDGTVDGVDYSAKYYAQSILPIKDDITAVAEIATDVSDVAEIKDDVTAVAHDKANIDAVAEDITNVNTVAGDHANIQTVINNMTAINNAPTYANNSKIWAEGLDGEVAPLGGTHSSKGWAQIAEAAASGVQNPANRDLSNLTNTGQMIIDSVNGYISNCILEIPQNIKVTLENNVLTLKAGSILVNSGSTYSTYTTTSDLTVTAPNTSATEYMIFMYGNNNFAGATLDNIVSGPTDNKSGVPYHVWFDTNNRIINRYGSDGTTAIQVRYPICIAKTTNAGGSWDSFAKDSNGNDMIFNGACFVGHHAVVYPNVKVLTANGLKTNKVLASLKGTVSSVQIVELSSGDSIIDVTNAGSCSRRKAYTEVTALDTTQGVQYLIPENKPYLYNGSIYSFRTETPIISYVYNGTTVTDFTIRQPVRLATTEMLDKVQDQVDTKQDTLVSGTNIKTINSTSVLGSGNFTLADQSLSNLDSTGQMVVDSQNGTISNCILEIPQNIKISISNNVITLASGSVVALTGYNTYTTRTTTANITKDSWRSDWYNKTVLLYIGSTGTWFGFKKVSKVGSGSSLPVDNTNFDDFYLTTDYSWYEWENGTWSKKDFSYPIAIVNVDSNGVASFAKDSNGNDMIFNGAGFIGHHAFVLPNVKALVCKGYKEDGTLGSLLFNNQSLQIIELRNPSYTPQWYYPIQLNAGGNVAGNAYRHIKTKDELLQRSALIQYVESDNLCYLWNGSSYGTQNWCPFVDYNYDGTTVTDFTIRQPYEGARNLLTDDIEEEVATKQVDVTTLTGYDSTSTQTLKNINGVLTWVTD